MGESSIWRSPEAGVSTTLILRIYRDLRKKVEPSASLLPVACYGVTCVVRRKTWCGLVAIVIA